MGAKGRHGGNTLDRRWWHDVTRGQQQGWGMGQQHSWVGCVVGEEEEEESKRSPGLGPEHQVVSSTEGVMLGKEQREEPKVLLRSCSGLQGEMPRRTPAVRQGSRGAHVRTTARR